MQDLHDSAKPRKKKPRGKPFSGKDDPRRGTGRTSQEIAVERDKKAFCAAFADEVLPDGRSSLRAVMESIRTEAIAGSAPHQKLFLAYTVGEPDQNVNLNGDFKFTLGRTVKS